MTKLKTYSERRKEALDKCNEICHREYDKYLAATQAARDEWFETTRQIDAEAGARSQDEPTDHPAEPNGSRETLDFFNCKLADVMIQTPRGALVLKPADKVSFELAPEMPDQSAIGHDVLTSSK